MTDHSLAQCVDVEMVASVLTAASSAQTVRFDIHGIQIDVPESLLTPELLRAFSGGYYEGSEIAALDVAIRPGDTVLELGAGVGFICSYIIKKRGAGRVVTVEADPQLLPTIERNLALNGVSALVLNGVVGSTSGPTKFYRQPSFWASSPIELPGTPSIVLPGIRLQRLIAEHRPDVLVVDIEGGERDVFQGVDFGNIRCIVVEIHRYHINGSGVARCFDALSRAGFAYDPNGSGGTNVVFTRIETSAQTAYWSRLVWKWWRK